jgi:hypothetical protein
METSGQSWVRIRYPIRLLGRLGKIALFGASLCS